MSYIRKRSSKSSTYAGKKTSTRGTYKKRKGPLLFKRRRTSSYISKPNTTSSSASYPYRKPVVSPADASIRPAGDGSVVITHSEYVGAVAGSTSYALSEANCNPGNIDMFPWLSQFATSFEQYQFLSLEFRFVSTSGNAISGTNPAIGSVMMSFVSDASTAAVSGGSVFSGRIQQENYGGTVSCRPSQSFRLCVDLKKRFSSHMPLYVRAGVTPSSTLDPRLYDEGIFAIGTTGMPAANTIGEVWIDYKVKFIQPCIIPSVSSTMLQAHWSAYTGSSPVDANTMTSSNYFGVNSAITDGVWVPQYSTYAGSPDGFYISITTGVGTCYFPLIAVDCYYEIFATWGGTETILTVANTIVQTSTDSKTFATTTAFRGVGRATTTAGTQTSRLLACHTVFVPASTSCSFVFAGTLPTTPTSFDLIITRYAGGGNLMSPAEHKRANPRSIGRRDWNKTRKYFIDGVGYSYADIVKRDPREVLDGRSMWDCSSHMLASREDDASDDEEVIGFLRAYKAMKGSKKLSLEEKVGAACEGKEEKKGEFVALRTDEPEEGFESLSHPPSMPLSRAPSMSSSSSSRGLGSVSPSPLRRSDAVVGSLVSKK